MVKLHRNVNDVFDNIERGNDIIVLTKTVHCKSIIRNNIDKYSISGLILSYKLFTNKNSTFIILCIAYNYILSISKWYFVYYVIIIYLFCYSLTFWYYHVNTLCEYHKTYIYVRAIVYIIS